MSSRECPLTGVHVPLYYACRHAGRITEGPRNQTVQPGVWVSFNCTVPCESCVNAWYVEGFPAILNPEEESTDELQLRSQYTQRADGMYTATLEILATEALDGVAVQCSTIFRDETCQPGQEPGSCGSFVTDFSRFAVLSGITSHLPFTYYRKQLKET